MSFLHNLWLVILCRRFNLVMVDMLHRYIYVPFMYVNLEALYSRSFMEHTSTHISYPANLRIFIFLIIGPRGLGCQTNPYEICCESPYSRSFMEHTSAHISYPANLRIFIFLIIGPRGLGCQTNPYEICCESFDAVGFDF